MKIPYLTNVSENLQLTTRQLNNIQALEAGSSRNTELLRVRSSDIKRFPQYFQSTGSRCHNRPNMCFKRRKTVKSNSKYPNADEHAQPPHHLIQNFKLMSNSPRPRYTQGFDLIGIDLHAPWVTPKTDACQISIQRRRDRQPINWPRNLSKKSWAISICQKGVL